ncbi:RagB/SusD family nutrient uptake outer membrane protein [Pedobacter psychrodurus]|uniref:RagB/SusD family nutrient uptake outer membrane protein n=1 Tax=Pedobacter psychrodurus TaxID=2530456 RepID=UPI00292D40E9|nr:RagB/SusD family nutrient uptake outer membrane protein [Pedobacter psychrodurus]
MKFKNIIIALSFMGLVSCKKDLLDSKPLNLISDETLWSDVNLVEKFVNEKYVVLPHFYMYSGVPSHLGYAAASDETYAKFLYENVNRITTGALSADLLALDSWTVDYNYIRELNVFFSKIESVPGDQGKKNRLKGEATFLRAYCYFDLASKYGGVPLITKVYNATDQNFVEKRASYEEVIKFVVDELDKAVPLLPLSYSANLDLGRATKGAALALKSRTLLYAASPLWNTNNDQTKWKAAADAAKAVIDMNQYVLYQGDYHNLFIQPDLPEVIIGYHIDPIKTNAYSDTFFSPCGSNGYSAYIPTQHIVDQFEMKNGKMITETGSGYSDQNPYIDRDPRFYANILYNGAQFKGRTLAYYDKGADSRTAPVNAGNASNTCYNWKKYNDETHNEAIEGESKTPFIIFRLSEIYLNYAEALNGAGNDGEAIIWLNKIRQRTGVNMPAVSATGTDLRDKIRHEREVELCLEGHRFFDVRRWKIAEITDNKNAMGVNVIKNANGSFTYDYSLLVETRKFDATKHYLFPIPKYELDKVKLVQNPNY